ncbi:MAG: GNAT family N-acetyltransferase [Gemmatimonadetes bacterium]|nr:GNAT family N-acetyltransferase [Gemmatimonadota bacterium]
MTITIRLGEPADAAALAALAARTFFDTFAESCSAEDMAQHLAESYGTSQQGGELADPRTVTLLVHVYDALAAYAQLRREPPPACVLGDAPLELWRFYVAKEWHGRGIAQALMDRVIAEAGRLGARTLWLGVWEHNERAKAFYRRCGFVSVGTQVYLVGADPQTDFVLRRPVNDASIEWPRR